MTERTARLDQLLQEEISRIVAREVEDPRIGFATITRVETSPDLRHARVWVSIIGQPDERKTTFRALARAMPFVRHELGALRLRRIPELHLLLDESVERGTRVLQILDALEAGREPEPAQPGETLPTPGRAADDDTQPDDGITPGDQGGAERAPAEPAASRPLVAGGRPGSRSRGGTAASGRRSRPAARRGRRP